MKKQLSKIAIKYSAENLIKHRKRVNILIRDQNICVETVKSKMASFNRERSIYLVNRFTNNKGFVYVGGFHTDQRLIELGYEILTMPQDFEKLKSYFEEPKIKAFIPEFNPDSIEYKYEKALANIDLLEKQQYKTPAQAFNAKRVNELEQENKRLKQANSVLKETNEDLVSRIIKCGKGLE